MVSYMYTLVLPYQDKNHCARDHEANNPAVMRPAVCTGRACFKSPLWWRDVCEYSLELRIIYVVVIVVLQLVLVRSRWAVWLSSRRFMFGSCS